MIKRALGIILSLVPSNKLLFTNDVENSVQDRKGDPLGIVKEIKI